MSVPLPISILFKIFVCRFKFCPSNVFRNFLKRLLYKCLKSLLCYINVQIMRLYIIFLKQIINEEEVNYNRFFFLANLMLKQFFSHVYP